MLTGRWITRVSLIVLPVAIVLWFFVGFLPQYLYADLSQAAAYGDSFGFVNSLFSSFGFAFVALALLLQMKELHDTSRAQDEQARMQLEQMRIAERTARIQEGMRLDSQRRLAMEAFLKINRDTLNYRHALLEWHPHNSAPSGNPLVDQEVQRRLKRQYFDAFTSLRSNCLSIGLIFDRRGDGLGKAIQDLYANAHQWTTVPVERVPTPSECEAQINQQIKRIEQEMQPLWESLSPSSG